LQLCEFFQVRRIAGTYIGLVERMDKLEKNQSKNDKNIQEVFKIINYLIDSGKENQKEEIGF